MTDDIITQEKMSRFVEDNRDFLTTVWEWVFERAEIHDIETLDLFTAWITVTLKQSSQLMHQDIKALKNGQIH
jgi:hypothetical protein